jgi:homoserine O-succinyltransferase
MLNHLEYDNWSLGDEYTRDLKAGLNPAQPVGYYPNDNPDKAPQNRWRSHGFLLFQNWINEIYQTTPFELNKVGTEQL